MLETGAHVEDIELAEARIRVAVWGSGKAEIVLLHDGLGSIGQWRQLPEEIVNRTGMTVMAYDRPGHGGSVPIPTGAWPADWMQSQAVLLAELLEALDLEAPVLVGHSDGGSIALIHAGTNPWSQRGVIALAAHSYVEQVCVDAISALRANPDLIIKALAKFHEDSSATFAAWSGGWTSPAFQSWDVRPILEHIMCPTLVAQGTTDEYASAAMVGDTVAAIESGTDLVEGRLLRSHQTEGQETVGLGHMLHLEAPELVVDLVAEFCDKLSQ